MDNNKQSICQSKKAGNPSKMNLYKMKNCNKDSFCCKNAPNFMKRTEQCVKI